MEIQLSFKKAMHAAAVIAWRASRVMDNWGVLFAMTKLDEIPKLNKHAVFFP